MPERIQLKRTKGWRMPPNTVKVDRTTKWGNPYKFGCAERRGYKNTVLASQKSLVDAFRRYAERCIAVNATHFEELRGKNLGCWCKIGEPCHADVLLELANAQGEAGKARSEGISL